MKVNKIYQGDALSTLKTFEDESINMCMTSPPYWALRDYGTASWEGGDEKCDHITGRANRNITEKSKKQTTSKGSFASETRDACPKCGAVRKDKQLGLEPTFEKHINKMCDVFDEVKRVLRKDGTCWVNYGDTYSNSSSGSVGYSNKSTLTTSSKKGSWAKGNKIQELPKKENTLPTKSLTMIPFRFAIEMVNRGWILRNTIIWHKPNPMPSSAKDRFTVDFEYLFFFSKSKKYYFEQQFEPHKEVSKKRAKYSKNAEDSIKRSDKMSYASAFTDYHLNPSGRNTRTVWKIPTQPFPEAHFAVYPEKLCRTPIRAGCPEFICKKCGKAREKIIERQKPPEEVFTKTKLHDGVGHFTKDGKIVGMGQKLQKWLNENPPKDKGLTDCGCNAGFRKGTVLDPFIGAGTTAVVARKLGRDYIGIELSKEYIKIAEKRLSQQVLT